MTFGEAFAKARKEQGSGGVFTYKGKKYSTNRADDKAKTAKNNVEKKADIIPVKKPKVEKKTEKKKVEEDKISLVDRTKNFKDKIFRPNVRQYLYDIFGGSGDITEDDYGPEYLDSMRELAQNAIDRGSTSLDYEDYDIDSFNKGIIENMYGSGVDHGKMFDLKTLIGGGNLMVEDGNLYITDDYDFNVNHNKSGDRYTPGAGIPERSFSNLPGILSTIADRVIDPYGDTSSSGSMMDAIRTAAAYVSSTEQDQDKSRAKINLGPASDFYDEDQLAGIMSTKTAKDII
jgi:hypothetical protein